MDGIGIVVSANSFSSYFFILLCFSLYLVIWRKQFHFLSKPGKRLASLMLAAQVIVIVMSQVVGQSSDFQAWLWSIGNEWTIESVLSSTQFALVGLVALLISWLNTADRPWRRLYLVAIALLFLYLGLDEYFAWKNYIVDWTDSYIVFGIMFAALTLIVIETSASGARRWLIILILGVSTAAFGAIAVDNVFPKICNVDLGFIHLEGCINFGLLDELLELAGGWIALLAILIRFAEVAPSASTRIRRLLYLLPALWILLLVQSDAIHPLGDQTHHLSSATVKFESGVTLLGYRSRLSSNNMHVDIYAAPSDWDFKQMGYSLHLVDQASGESLAGQDNMLNQHLEFYMTPGLAPAYRQWAAIPLPANKPANRALSIVLTIWRKEGDKFLRQKIIESDHPTLDDTQVVLGEVVFPPKITNSALSIFENGFILVAMDMPTRAQPGDSMPITFSWASENDASEDHSQFLHLRHDDSGEWWVYDQQPLGARLPTRLWYSGLADSETWNVPLPADLVPGLYQAFTGLYRQRDLARVPAKNVNGEQFADARVPLGSLTIEADM